MTTMNAFQAQLDTAQAPAIRVLSENELDTVSGGFVCGGLCIAAAAFGAGALFGAGVAIGWHSERRR